MSAAYAYQPGDESWRPHSLYVARRAVARGVPPSFLDTTHLAPELQALVRACVGTGTSGDVALLLDALGYRDTKWSRDEHLYALGCAVGRLADSLETHGNFNLAHRPIRFGKGQPSHVEPYIPARQHWAFQFAYLRRLFRDELKNQERHVPESGTVGALSFDKANGDAGPFESDGEWLGTYRPQTYSAVVARRQEARETLLHHPQWSCWHGVSRSQAALAVRHQPRLKRRLTLDGRKTKPQTIDRQVSPPLSRWERRALRREIEEHVIHHPPMSQPENLGPPPAEEGHPDNRAFVAQRRAKRNALVSEEDPDMSTIATDERVSEEVGRLLELSAEIADVALVLRSRFPDNEEIATAVDRFLEGAR